MDKHIKIKFRKGTILLILSFGWHFAFGFPLTLKEAENRALAQAPEIKSLQAQTYSMEQSAIAAGQLSDPKLLLGALNVPVNTFDFGQEPMTQKMVGLQQDLPRGRSLHYRSLQKKDLARAESFKLKAMQLQVLQGVRLSWLHLYYWLHAKHIILGQKKVFRNLLQVTQSLLANNKAQQKDVIRAQLELTELDNRLLEMNQQIDTARAELERWIGPVLAQKAQPEKLLRLPSLPTTKELCSRIKHHPVLKTDEALIFAERAHINLAEQQYKPGFNIGAAYGFRQGHNIDGSKRADFLTAQVSMDLPLFPKNRQDRIVNARIASLAAAKENQMSHYRLLREALKTQIASWEQQHQSVLLYQKHLTPEAQQYAQATLIAYQNAQTDFPTLARAYVRELDTELGGLKARVSQDIARVNLFYLEGM
jgi:outer membrane protein TolC